MIDILGQIERWREQLLDISKRNRLINCQIGGRGALRLDHPTPDVVWREILSGKSMVFRRKSELIDEQDEETNDEQPQSLLSDAVGEGRPQTRDEMQACLESPLLNRTDLLTDMTDKRLGGRLSRLSLNARTTLSEQGINSLFLAFGMLRWYESIDSDVAIRSPLLLVPVELKRAGVDKPWMLSLYEEEVHANHCLSQIMKSSFDAELPEIPEDTILDAESGRTDYFKLISDSIDDQSRWEVEDVAVLGTFSFQKISMWDDLGKNAEQVAGHGMCQAIAGAEVPDLTPEVDLPSPREFDSKIKPQDLHLILDADSSQLEALVAAKNGLNLVVDGPPGTGKSQTIANIIAECLASGKTVLFVSEKAAALEVVKHRLDGQKLGDFCLECHSHKANKKEVIAELGRCLALPQESYRDQTEDLDRLYESRQTLNAYVDSLHQKRSHLNLSAFHVHGLLAEIHVDGVSRCDIPNILNVDAATLRRITTALDRLGLCREVIASPDTHPWHGCLADSHSLTLEDDIRHYFQLLAERCADLSRIDSPLVAAGLCPENPSKQDVDKAVTGIRQILELPQLPSTWFEEDPSAVAKAFVELDGLSAKYRSLLESTKPIREEYLEAAASLLAALSGTSSMTNRIRLGSPKLSQRIREHELLLRMLDDVRDAVQKVGHEVAKVAKLMHVTLSDPSLRVLSKLLTIGKLVAQVGLAHESWFESSTRKKLLQDADECIEQLALADRVKAEFGRRLTRFAYEDEGQEIAEKFTQFEGFWARWFKGGWKQLKEEAVDLYQSEPPRKTPIWLDDMRNLRRFHRRRTQIIRITKANTDTLLREDGGTADWKNLFTILSALEAMQDEFKVPASLRQALTTTGAIDREALAMVVVDLEIGLTQLDGKMTSLNETYDAISRVGGKHGYRDLSAGALMQWLDDAKRAVANRLSLLSDLDNCLHDGQDMSLADELMYRNVLKHILDTKRDVDMRLEQLGSLASLRGSPYACDWYGEAELAKAYLWYTSNATTRENPSFTPLLYDSSLRESCEATVNEIASTVDEAFANSWRFLGSVFDLSQPVSLGTVITDASLKQLSEWLTARVGDVKLVHEWIEYSQIRELLCNLRVSTVLAEVETSTIPVDDATNAFRARFFRLWLDQVYSTDPMLSQFSVEEHEQLIGSFQELDVLTTDATFKRIRSRLLNDPQRPHIGMVNAPSTSEVGILLHEVNKKRRHKSLRRLFRDLPTLLTRLKPCVMMSPLAVSTYFESDDVKFDAVIFDEASQVRPFDAIGAIYRGKQLIVAGDQKQLPPTTFFDKLAEDDSGDPDEEATGNLTDFESILDVCCTKGLPRKRLRWHYRSRREPLIGFSNHHFYDNELITFPSVDDVDGTGAVDLEFVDAGRWKSGSSGGYNLREAEHTALLIVEHFSRDPEQSLGVITFNQKQQLAVLDQLTLLRKSRPEFDKFFDEEKSEPFFVKNLENVQGDERDVIFLSMGYGRDDNGKFAMRFGPLNRQGGERRLNVAVTRAKHHVKMIASVKSHDIDLNRTNSVGARLLKHYLEYAERGTDALGAEVTDVYGDEFDSPFEREVAEELRRQDFDTRTQVGCSGFRIDLAIVHPEEPGRYVLGVECDGATYHSSATARDRDRLRQSILEALGWHICRIWSTDWVRDPQRQIQRVREAFEFALASPRNRARHRQPNNSANEERPRIKHKQNVGDLYGKFGYYSEIREVDGTVIENAITSILRSYGATQKNELLKCVSQSLGFSRLGPRIRSAVESSLGKLTTSGSVTTRDDEVYSLPIEN